MEYNSYDPHGQETGEREQNQKKGNYFFVASVAVSLLMMGTAWLYTIGAKEEARKAALARPPASAEANSLEAQVLPQNGVVLPVRWGNLGAELVRTGVIDRAKFESLYGGRGGLTAEEKVLLSGEHSGNLKITPENSGVILNLLWALGLGTKNDILTSGLMMDPKYGDPGNFASTGGWTLARGDAMDHYSMHPFVTLTAEQEELVGRVARNIYRPCCDNATHFPDCNHGMAMLGLLELMASQGASEDEMYRTALQVNAYWFPDAYLAIAEYHVNRGIEWKNADAQELLGYDYSSGSGYRQILSEVTPPARKPSGSCGV